MLAAISLLAASLTLLLVAWASGGPLVRLSPGGGSPSAGGNDQGGDFRFLPAVAGSSGATPSASVAPTSSPLPGFQVGLVRGGAAPLRTATVRLTWRGVDPASLGRGVWLRTDTTGQPAETTALGAGASRAVISLGTGSDYTLQLRVRRSKTAPSVAEDSVRLRSIDDDAGEITYDGSWATAAHPGYLHRSARYSSSRGSTATLEWTGRSVAWIGPIGPGRGTATVSVDGKVVATISTSAPRYQPRRTLFAHTWAKSGNHSLAIEVRGDGNVAIDSFTMVVDAPGPEPSERPTPSGSASGGSLASASLPVRAALFYAWYPEAWTSRPDGGFGDFHASAGAYDSSDPAIIDEQIKAMLYGHITSGLVSWWGEGTRSDGRLPALLAAASGTGFTWAIDVGLESVGDPAPDEIAGMLRYVADQYGSDPSYLRIGGRIVVAVSGDAADGCEMADRWVQGNVVNAYLILPAFDGYQACASQPDRWYGSDPAQHAQPIGKDSYTIRPGGYSQADDPAEIARDPDRWAADVRAMVASGADLQLVASFNQWGDGTSVESAREWQSASGYGRYLDVLHADGKVGETASEPTGDPVLVGAGAIAGCDSPNDEATAQLVAAVPGTVFTVGDNAFPNGSLQDFRGCYGPSWGAFLDRTRPAIGTHEYQTPDAAGYFGYFGKAAGAPGKGYYAYNLGAWRIYVLNANCGQIGGCARGSPQERWLRADLKAHPTACIGAYWQLARFSSGRFGDDSRVDAFWTDLYRYGVEFVVNGHDHNYQRYAPMNPNGDADPSDGIREFIVGTGGYGHTTLQPGPIPNREVANDQVYGVLQLTLHKNSYEWRFIATDASAFSDSGAQACH